MIITTKHTGVIRDLERLIKTPVKGIRVERMSANDQENAYDVSCRNFLDVTHECKQLSIHTADIKFGGKT